MIEGFAAFHRIQHLLQTNKWVQCVERDCPRSWRQERAVELSTSQQCKFIIALGDSSYTLYVEGFDQQTPKRRIYQKVYSDMTQMQIADIEAVIVNPELALRAIAPGLRVQVDYEEIG